MDERTIGRMHESTAGVLAYRHTGRRSDSETDDDRNNSKAKPTKGKGKREEEKNPQEKFAYVKKKQYFCSRFWE